MNDLPLPAAPAHAAEGSARPLSEIHVGDRGVILKVAAARHGGHGVDEVELERRLLEFGFVEGARIEVLHEGAIRRDPIAVRLDGMRVALRRRDAQDVLILLDAPSS